MIDLTPRPIPITLYVEKIDSHPEFDDRIDRRKTAVDLELTIKSTEQLIEELKSSVKQHKPIGTIRIRFTGRLVT
jgi:hypothetical protein